LAFPRFQDEEGGVLFCENGAHLVTPLHTKKLDKRSRRLNSSIFVAMFLIFPCSASALHAQETPPAVVAPRAQAPTELSSKTSILPAEHKFWDKENDLLFAGVAASRTLDYFSTLNMRRRGRQEIFLTNDAVDNHAAFAAIEAASAGVSVGASYLFHHYGHHKLERWTSIVHIGLATTGAVRNYCLKTAHPAGAP
jgi:hypothetical protein